MPNRMQPGCKCCPTGPPPPCVIDLCIFVKKQGTENTIAGAAVEVIRDSDNRSVAEGVTDGDGKFCVKLEGEDAEAGFHTLVVSRFCHLPWPGTTNPISLFCGEENHNFFMVLDPDCLDRCEECPPGTAYPKAATVTLGTQWGIYNDVSGSTTNFTNGTFPNHGFDATPGAPWSQPGQDGRPTGFTIDQCAQTVDIQVLRSSGATFNVRLCRDGIPPNMFGFCLDSDPLCPEGPGSASYANGSGNQNATITWTGPPLPMTTPMAMTAPDEGPTDDDRPSGAAMLANARDCPHREPIPKSERAGCGCSHRCAAGQSPRPDGSVTVAICWDCPIAPRRSP